ncbi:MAG: hypothetical protein V4478_01800 [Patescibacteria group bacterium]
MQIKPERMEEFKRLYKELHGIDLSDSEAYEKAHLLIDYVMLCVKPLKTLDDEPFCSNETAYSEHATAAMQKSLVL